MSDFLSDIVVNKKTNYVYKEPISIELDCPDFKKDIISLNEEYEHLGRGKLAKIDDYLFAVKYSVYHGFGLFRYELENKTWIKICTLSYNSVYFYDFKNCSVCSDDKGKIYGFGSTDVSNYTAGSGASTLFGSWSFNYSKSFFVII